MDGDDQLPKPRSPAAGARASKPRGKPQERRETPPPAANPRLAQQNRKILGKHYANRFGKR
jgi:hypothetical protein